MPIFWSESRGKTAYLRNLIIQSVKQIITIIVTDNYLCYREPKSPYNFFLILIFNELITFKTSDDWQHWKTGNSTLDWNEIELFFTQSSFSNFSVTSPTSQLILQPFRRFTYVTAHSPTLPLLHLRHSSFSNSSFASLTSQALHLRHLASRPWCS